MMCLSVACVRHEPPMGQLMVTVTTDAPLPDYVDGIRLVATHEYGGKVKVVFDREPEVVVGAGQLLIPTTLALVSNGRATDRVKLSLLARKLGKDRVLRTVVTQIPLDRIAELHLPIEWLCDGSAVPGDPLYCSDPLYTCAGGRCVPQYIDPATLPNYVPPASGTNDGGASPQPAGPCFDIAACFEDARAVPLNQADCSIAIPSGDASQLNLAMVVRRERGGQCIPGGNCLVPLSRGGLGWSLSADGTRIQLPAAVCTTRAADVIAVVASSRCPSKAAATSLCGAWSPFVAPVAQDAGASDSAPPAFAYCRNASDCASGHCADGVCCSESCSGACRSCALPGKEGTCITVVEGTVDPRGVCVPAQPGSCGFDGTCSAEATCRFWADGTSCGMQTCMAVDPAVANTSSVRRFACDGLGTCRQSAIGCAGYACASNACLLGCRSNADCSQGFACDCVGAACQAGGRCIGAIANGQPCSLSAQCIEGACASGACDSSVARLGFDGASNGAMISGERQLGVGTMRVGRGLDSPPTPVETVMGRAGGKALWLDGANKFVTFPAAAALNKLAQSGKYTVAAWVWLEPPIPEAWILSRPLAQYPDNHHFGLGHSPSAVPFVSLSNASYPVADNSPLPSRTWVHVASTYDGRFLAIYVNGVEKRRVDVSYTFPIDDATPLVIGGGRSVQNGFTFRGAIDEVWLLDRALSQAQVVEMMGWR